MIHTKIFTEERELDHTVSAKGIIWNNGKILMMRRTGDDPANGGGWWDIPGGAVEKGESLLDCLKRETFEESGLKDLENIRPYKTVKYIVPERGINATLHLFIANSPSNAVELKPATWEGANGKPEHTEYKWVNNLLEFDVLPLIKPLRDAIRPLILRRINESFFTW